LLEKEVGELSETLEVLMRRSIEEILKQQGLLHSVFSRPIKISELEGVDPHCFETIPDNASVIAIDQERFRQLPEDEQRILCEAGYGICDVEVWSIDPLDEESISDVEEVPEDQNTPLHVHPDYYVVIYKKNGKTCFLPLRKILRHAELH
jgi:hypothetical protein